MTESVLKSIMRLYAIIGNIKRNYGSELVESDYTHAREITEAFLGQLVNPEQSQKYLQMFDFHYHNLERRGIKQNLKRISLFSVKTLLICEQINNHLSLTQKVFVLLQLFDILKKDNEDTSEAATNYINTVSGSFGVLPEESEALKSFVFSSFQQDAHNNSFLVITGEKYTSEFQHHLYRENMSGCILVFYLPSIQTYFFRHEGSDDWLYINGRSVIFNRIYILEKGTTIRCPKIQTIYYSDIVGNFLHAKSQNEIQLVGLNIEFNFKNSDNGIKKFNFEGKNGDLIGIMGGSGVGKSTFLSVMNGTLKPTSGRVLINGIDIYENNDEINGIIGYIPQDDFLVEELTVFDNLYFNARFSFDNYSETEIIETVDKLLKDLSLYDIRNLKVGSSLNKYISGGQRKRLNIALELLREPYLLFVDEPTSGLSSNDSEKVMELLKQQTYNGRLVIVNIHQPSSDIFKLFDKLLVMDKGGRPIYYGNAIESLSYFKTATQLVNSNESECIWCGNLNPEQVLHIIETIEVDEKGNLTGNRMVSPEDWYQLYLNSTDSSHNIQAISKPLPVSGFRLPNKFTQFVLYFLRNIKCKLTDRQYMLVNMLEAPVLAFILSFFTRYAGGPNGTYIFSENINIPVFIFMSIVVSLFLGMMGSAEEIISDAKLLKREGFLNLSRYSYLNSKVVFLFGLSAIQMFVYVIICHYILSIHGMLFTTWLMLFSVSCFANIMGLILSSGMRSVVAIYILIPLLLIPQLLLSGIIVHFDKLQSLLKSDTSVPIIGDVMASRWAYEAISVEQFKNNAYEVNFYEVEMDESNATYCTNYWIPELLNRAGACELYIDDNSKHDYLRSQLQLIGNEVKTLANFLSISGFDKIDSLKLGLFNTSLSKELTNYLKHCRTISSKLLSRAQDDKDIAIQKLQIKLGSHEKMLTFKEENYNNSLADQVLNKNEQDKIIESNGRLVRKFEPVFSFPESKVGRGHFYAPVKFLGNYSISTYWFNLMVLWLMSLCLYVLLFTNMLGRIVNYLQPKK